MLYTIICYTILITEFGAQAMHKMVKYSIFYALAVSAAICSMANKLVKWVATSLVEQRAYICQNPRSLHEHKFALTLQSYTENNINIESS